MNKHRVVSEEERNFHLAESRRRGEIAYQLDLTDAYEQGIEQGIERGIALGRERAIEAERIEVARRMISKGLARTMVAVALGISEDDVAALLAT